MSHPPNIKFSIILPVRNGGEFVKECIRSILAQSVNNYNLIILDNASTDGTLDWIMKLNNEKIVCYPSDKQLSIEENWARIKEVPRNEFMTMIGHDDLLHPDYLTVMNELISQNPDASLYQTHFRYIDKNGVLLRKCQPMNPIQTADEFLLGQIVKSIDSTGTGYMMRSKDYDALGGIPSLYPNLIYADYELWVRLTHLSFKATSPRECFSYRIHSSMSALTNGEAYQEAFGKYVLFLNDIREKDSAIDTVLSNYGKRFLMDNCESLSHRILKTALSNRKISVWTSVKKSKSYAELLIPGQSFHPLLKPRILLAVLLDNKLGIMLFMFVKRFRNKGVTSFKS